MKTPFNTVLRKQREKLGIGLREFAGEIALSPGYVSRVESDAYTEQPSDVALARWASRLGLSVDDIFWRAGRLPPEDVPRLRRDAEGVSAFLRALAGQRYRNRKTGQKGDIIVVMKRPTRNNAPAPAGD